MIQFPDFTKVFEVEYDALRNQIGRVLSQKRHPLTYFSGKLDDAKLKYSTYDKEFYVIFQFLKEA
jgi:hypothetical protein